MSDEPKGRLDKFVEGPRHWNHFWRRIWLCTLPIGSVFVWPIIPWLLIIVVGIPAFGIYMAYLWAESIWRNEPMRDP